MSEPIKLDVSRSDRVGAWVVIVVAAILAVGSLWLIGYFLIATAEVLGTPRQANAGLFITATQLSMLASMAMLLLIFAVWNGWLAHRQSYVTVRSDRLLLGPGDRELAPGEIGGITLRPARLGMLLPGVVRIHAPGGDVVHQVALRADGDPDRLQRLLAWWCANGPRPSLPQTFESVTGRSPWRMVVQIALLQLPVAVVVWYFDSKNGWFFAALLMLIALVPLMATAQGAGRIDVDHTGMTVIGHSTRRITWDLPTKVTLVPIPSHVAPPHLLIEFPKGTNPFEKGRTTMVVPPDGVAVSAVFVAVLAAAPHLGPKLG